MYCLTNKILDCRDFLNELEKYRSEIICRFNPEVGEIPKLVITTAEDGELNISYNNKDVYLDLGFYGDGCYSYYATTENQVYAADNISVKAQLPFELLLVLEKIV